MEMVEAFVRGVVIDETNNSPILILQEVKGNRFLPIWIGMAEAHSIIIELNKQKFPRPLTHDLLKFVIEGLGGKVLRVDIMDMRDSMYFGRIIIQRDDEIFTFDSRPSDSVALAIRVDCPIYVLTKLLMKEKFPLIDEAKDEKEIDKDFDDDIEEDFDDDDQNKLS